MFKNARVCALKFYVRPFVHIRETIHTYIHTSAQTYLCACVYYICLWSLCPLRAFSCQLFNGFLALYFDLPLCPSSPPHIVILHAIALCSTANAHSIRSFCIHFPLYFSWFHTRHIGIHLHSHIHALWTECLISTLSIHICTYILLSI